MPNKTPSIRKVAITGPESTGKSQLAHDLAQHYQSLYVPEFARYYLDIIKRPYQESDLLYIAQAQRANEIALSTQAQQVLFLDTEMLVMKIWSENAYQTCPPWIMEQWAQQNYDLYLLMDIDLPWEPDPQREHPKQRSYFFNLYLSHLKAHSLNFQVISGRGKERLLGAIQAVDPLLEL